MSRLAKRATVAAVLVVAVVGSTLAFGPLAGGIGAGPAQEPETGLDVAGQNHLDHEAHLAEMKQIAADNGLDEAPGTGLCGDWFQFRTETGLHCSPGPMTRDMFTEAQLTDPPRTAADTTAAGDAFVSTPRVSCIGSGSDGKRVQLVYARRSNKADRFLDTAAEMKWWAHDIEDVMLTSARKTDGSRRVRWVTDGLCSAKVLNVVVPDSVTTFSQLVSAMEAKGYTSTSRKYLVAWDDGDATGGFCGLGEVWYDSSPGSGNRNEAQPSAQYAAVENGCWSSGVAAHELMHTLGAVQHDAPNASPNGHCTDEYDVMCYVDGPGVVMRQVCGDYAQEDLYDCNNDDYFHTKPGAGSYLATHWNTANSGWLDKTVIPVPPDAPRFITASAGAESVTVNWSAPLFDGGSAVLGYEVDVGPARKVVGPGTFTATLTGIPDGTSVSGTVRAINAAGVGEWSYGIPVLPSPPVTTKVTTADGETIADVASGANGSAYVARADRIDRIDANGTITTVVQGPGTGEGTAPLATEVHPGALAFYQDVLYWYDTQFHTVRQLKAGTVTTIAGNGTEGTTGNGGPATAAALRVYRIAVGPPSSGTEPRVHLLDKIGSNVRTFVVGGTIASSAGVLGQPGYSGDNATATAAQMNGPSDIAATANGWIYVADTGNNRIRSFVVAGKMYTDLGNGTTTQDSGSQVSALSGVAAPTALDWSADKGLLVESNGLIRFWNNNLFRLAGDPFTAGASDADGTLAMKISYRKTDAITAMAWSAGNLHVVTTGPNPSTSATRSRLRTAPYLLTGSAVPPNGFTAAPKAVAGPGSATITWVPPSNGGSAISSTTVTASPGGKTAYVTGEDATKAVINGLTPGTSYTFTIKVASIKGASPVSPASNAVVPTATPGYLPFTSWSGYVDVMYLSVLGRAPTSTERTKAVQSLTAGTTTAAGLVVSLRRSSENLTNVDPVVRLYRAFLARTPDAGGLQFWIKRRRTGDWKLARMADSFATSSEFTRKYGSLTNRAFVTRIYTDVLGRTADPSGVDYWTKKLDTKAQTRGGVMVGFSESNEYQRKQAVNTDLATAFVLLLLRAPDGGDESFWGPLLTDGSKTYDQLVTSLIESDEFLLRRSG